MPRAPLLLLLLLVSLHVFCDAQPFDFSQCYLGPEGIRIGRTVSNSGLYNAESLESRHGHEFWLDYQNNVLGGVTINGTRCQFSLETWNDGSDPALVARLYEDMITPCVGRNPVHLFLGPFSTLLTGAAIGVAKQYRVPIIFHSGSDPSLFTATPNGTVSFGMLVRSSKRSQVCVDALTKNFTGTPVIKTAALINMNETFQITSIRNIISQLQANGVSILYNITVPSDQVEFSDVIAMLAAQPPDMLVLGFVTTNSEPFLTELRDANINPAAVLLTSSATLASIDHSLPFQAQYIFSGDQWQPKLPYTDPLLGNSSAWADQFQSRFGSVPTLFAAAGFAAGLVLADAVSRAQSVDPDEVTLALRATNITASFFGPISFSSVGEPSLPAICTQTINDNLETVAPNNLITTRMIYPGIPIYPPTPKDNTAKRNKLIIGLTVGLGLLVIAGFLFVIWVVRSKYHLVFLSKDVKAERDTWG